VSTTVTRALDTIPDVLARAADRDADRVWLRTDDGSQTFAGAAGLAGALAHRLRDAGVRRGDLVVVTTRTTPAYLLTWLALAALGAVTVPTDPKGTPGELAGLVGQVRPRLLLTDAGLRVGVDQVVTGDLMPPLGVLDVEELLGDWRSTDKADWAALPTGVEPDDLAVLIPTSGTTGRSKLVMQTQRAYAMAGEGFPFWMELTADDRQGTDLVGILNEYAAERFFPGNDPIGRMLLRGSAPNAPRLTIVGVVATGRADGANAPFKPEIFVPITQRPSRGVFVVIEPSRDLAAATRAFAQSLKEVDPLIPVSAMQPVEERIGSSVALPRLYATLVGIFAGAALFLHHRGCALRRASHAARSQSGAAVRRRARPSLRRR